jgi:hypothetical protein
MKIRLERVHYMPKELEPNVLYVSEHFNTAAHLCACGCLAKIRTPLGPTEWAVDESSDGPSLWPSIGNWQQACKSHYVIFRGEIHWADMWTDSQILEGRLREKEGREEYYRKINYGATSRTSRIISWLMNFFR